MKNSNSKLTPADLPDWFRKTAVGQELVQQAAAKLQADRAVVVEAIAELTQREKKELPPLQAKVQARKAKEEAARARYDEATRERIQAEQKEHQLRGSCYHKRLSAEAFLRQTADPAHDVFIREMRLQFDEDRHGKCQWAGIGARLKAIREAINAAELLKLEVVDDVEGALAELRESLPPIDAMERV